MTQERPEEGKDGKKKGPFVIRQSFDAIGREWISLVAAATLELREIGKQDVKCCIPRLSATYPFGISYLIFTWASIAKAKPSEEQELGLYNMASKPTRRNILLDVAKPNSDVADRGRLDGGGVPLSRK